MSAEWWHNETRCSGQNNGYFLVEIDPRECVLVTPTELNRARKRWEREGRPQMVHLPSEMAKEIEALRDETQALKTELNRKDTRIDALESQLRLSQAQVSDLERDLAWARLTWWQRFWRKLPLCKTD